MSEDHPQPEGTVPSAPLAAFDDWFEGHRNWLPDRRGIAYDAYCAGVQAGVATASGEVDRLQDLVKRLSRFAPRGRELTEPHPDACLCVWCEAIHEATALFRSRRTLHNPQESSLPAEPGGDS